MIRIKESIHPSWKPGLISDGTYLEKAIRRKDGRGRIGLDFFNDHDIEIVRPDEKADFGISLHGDPVKDIPRSKCILLKGEPPIYNIYFGWNLCNQKFLDKFMATMSNTIVGNLKQIHFNSPQNCFEHMEKMFNQPKTEFLCMILKNKMRTITLNKLCFWFKKWNYYSNHKLRVEADKGLCRFFGPEKYHSYGRGWCERCFKGPVGYDGEKIIHVMNGNTKEKTTIYVNPIPPEYEIISKYKFNYCPENSRFNGYVTEKPIQAMACGSIPIYCGAPDVYNYLPEGTFISTDDYSPKGLCQYIQNMDEQTYRGYRERMRRFLTTYQSDNFSSYIFAEKIYRILEERYK